MQTEGDGHELVIRKLDGHSFLWGKETGDAKLTGAQPLASPLEFLPEAKTRGEIGATNQGGMCLSPQQSF